MIVNCVRGIAMVAVTIPHSHSQRSIIKCCAPPSSTINTEHLRSQLDHLHSEAHSTTTKANNARLRLLRLSEAAEKLQKQAAISIQKGEENDAREMLYQRKKVLQALENSKRRIELLDKLSIKLSEAISLKENQLIGNVTMNIEDTTEDASSPVRIIAPKEEFQKDFIQDDSDPNSMKFSNTQDVQLSMESQGNPLDEKETENLQGSLSYSNRNENNIASSLSEISSYEDFMEHIDQKLSEIEAELVTVLNVSTLVLNIEERPKNSRLQQTMELLESIHGIRQRSGQIAEGLSKDSLLKLLVHVTCIAKVSDFIMSHINVVSRRPPDEALSKAGYKVWLLEFVNMDSKIGVCKYGFQDSQRKFTNV